MGLEHAGVPVEYQGIVEAGDLNLVPCLAKHYIALQYLVFKSSPEATFSRVFLDNLLDLTSNTTNCTNLSTLKFSNFKFAVEHSLNEGSVLMDLEGLTDKLELFHDLKLGVQFNDCTCHAYSEMRNIFPTWVLKFLDPDECGTNCIGWSVEGGVTETEFRSVLDHS